MRRATGRALLVTVLFAAPLACASGSGPRATASAAAPPAPLEEEPPPRPDPQRAAPPGPAAAPSYRGVLEADPDEALLPDADALEDEEEWLADDLEVRDPLEPVNRPVFRFNDAFLDVVLDPVAQAYAWAVPDPARDAVHRFFANLNEPVTFVNDVFQLAPGLAARSGARFAINTTVGVVGLFDPATRWGIPRHVSDFGQTLGVHCVGSGPYLVIPFVGPSTVRDGLGEFIDFLLRVDTWFLAAGPGLLVYAGDHFATYDEERERLDALEEGSVDFYSALRAAYLMDRDAFIEARRRRLGRGASR